MTRAAPAAPAGATPAGRRTGRRRPVSPSHRPAPARPRGRPGAGARGRRAGATHEGPGRNLEGVPAGALRTSVTPGGLARPAHACRVRASVAPATSVASGAAPGAAQASSTWPARRTTGGSTDQGKLIQSSVRFHTYSHFTSEWDFS